MNEPSMPPYAIRIRELRGSVGCRWLACGCAVALWTVAAPTSNCQESKPAATPEVSLEPVQTLALRSNVRPTDLFDIEAIFPRQQDAIHLVRRKESGGEFELVVMDSKGTVTSRTSVVTPWPEIGRSVHWGQLSDQVLFVVRSGTEESKAAKFVAINPSNGNTEKSGTLDEIQEVLSVKTLPKGGCVVVGWPPRPSNGGIVLVYLDKAATKKWSAVDPNSVTEQHIASCGDERVCTYDDEKKQLNTYSIAKGLESSVQLEEPPRIVSNLVDDLSNQVTLLGRSPGERQESRTYGLRGQKLDQFRLPDAVLSRIHPYRLRMCVLRDGTLVVSDGYGVLRADLQKGTNSEWGRPNAETSVLEVMAATLDASNNLIVLDSRTRMLHTFDPSGKRVRALDVGNSVSTSERQFVWLGDIGAGSIALGPLPMNARGMRVAIQSDGVVSSVKGARLPFFAINTRTRTQVEWIGYELVVRDAASGRTRKFPTHGASEASVYDACPLDDGRVLTVGKELRGDGSGLPESVVRVYETDGSSNRWGISSGVGAIAIGAGPRVAALSDFSRNPSLAIIASQKVVKLLIPGKPLNGDMYRYLVKEDKNEETYLLEIDCLGARVNSYKIRIQPKPTK